MLETAKTHNSKLTGEIETPKEVKETFIETPKEVKETFIETPKEVKETFINALIRPQPNPKHSERPAVWDLVIADMKARDDFGREKYGTRLQPFNGRDTLVDAYQEVLDLAVYLRQLIYEREQAESTVESRRSKIS